MNQALAIGDLDEERRVYLGPARNAALLEVLTLVRADGSEVAIHAMGISRKFERFLSES
jgi:hypothetical protein